MSKSRRAFSPGSIGSGHRLADLEKARNERETSIGGRVRLLEWAYMGDPLTRQPAFCIYVAVRRSTGSGHRYDDRRATPKRDLRL